MKHKDPKTKLLLTIVCGGRKKKLKDSNRSLNNTMILAIVYNYENAIIIYPLRK